MVGQSAAGDPLIRYMTDNLQRYRGNTAIDDPLDYYLSFFTYHTRWDDLSVRDFGVDENCFFCFFIKTHAVAFNADEVKARFNATPVAIAKDNLQYLKDFLDFCDTLPTKVIFTQTPHCRDEQAFGQYNYIQQLIEARGYEFWNLNREMDAIGLNYQTDFADATHTNVYGASKISAYVARQLMQRFHFPDHRGDRRYAHYEIMSRQFKAKLQQAELKACTQFAAYLNKLAALDRQRHSIFIVIKDLQGYQLDPAMIDRLQQLGFQQTNRLLEHRPHSFIGIIANNQVVCQQLGTDNTAVHYRGRINGQTVQLASSPFNKGNRARIQLGTKDYAKNQRGFNIVVVDNHAGAIVDSVAFDTHVATMTCKR